MTKILSDLLGAHDPAFRFGVQELERASGAPAVDIRLTTEILHSARDAVRDLGLDPDDTTSEELYEAIQQRLAIDDNSVCRACGIDSAAPSSQVLAAAQKTATKLLGSPQCFALKQSVAKRLLKANPPKKTMKQLKYRSLDSMLKHESVANLYAAISLCEDDVWRQRQQEAYAQLRATDFEVRKLAITFPVAARWSALADSYVTNSKQNILCFAELGAMVILPLPSSVQLPGLLLVTLLLLLQAANDISAESSFLKLQQVKPDFGRFVADTSRGRSFVSARFADQPVTWRTLHRYFAESQHYPEHLLEPHVQQEDLRWQHAEQLLATLAPSLEFWCQNHFTALVRDGQVVSLNLLDAVLNYCNKLPYAQRVLHYVRDNAWHELIARYLHQESVEHAITEQLNNSLAPEMVTI